MPEPQADFVKDAVRRVVVFVGVLVVLLVVGLSAGQWVGPVDTASTSTGADPHANH